LTAEKQGEFLGEMHRGEHSSHATGTVCIQVGTDNGVSQALFLVQDVVNQTAEQNNNFLDLLCSLKVDDYILLHRVIFCPFCN